MHVVLKHNTQCTPEPCAKKFFEHMYDVIAMPKDISLLCRNDIFTILTRRDEKSPMKWTNKCL